MANEFIVESVDEKVAEQVPVAVQEAEVIDNQQELAQQMASIEQEAIGLTQAPIQQVQQQQEQQQQEQQIQPAPQVQNIETVSTNENPPVDTLLNSPVSAVLATRNMLRSRRKHLESTEKKPSDAIARQAPSSKSDTNLQQNKAVLPAESDIKAIKKIEPAPEMPYQAEKVDPSIVSKANQVDKWAHMIDSMELTARIRQLAIHATIDEKSTDENLILRLDQGTKHLYTEQAKVQLEQTLCEFLSKNITVTIDIVEKTIEDPYQIQSHINDKRYDYAKALLKEDDIVLSLQERFQATLDEESIGAL